MFGIGMPTTDLKSVNGQALTARDWSSDFAKLQNLDILLSSVRDRINELVLQASTTTALAANGTYTSSTLNLSGWGRIIGTVYADQAGTLYVEQSSDGTNFDSSSSFSVSAGSPFGFSVEVVAPYGRIRYVNGATAQTAFRLYAFTRRI
jgi:hypothetical protein